MTEFDTDDEEIFEEGLLVSESHTLLIPEGMEIKSIEKIPAIGLDDRAAVRIVFERPEYLHVE